MIGEKNRILMARAEYERAQRLAQREYSTLTSRGERGNLLVLDEIAGDTSIMAYVKQPTREIPLHRVVGTYTSSRAYSFSAGFLPMHPEGTEFATKWISLCASHMGEGLRDPIQVYEYMWNYYVVEGNKRVSVLKYFGAPAIRAEVTRLIPQLDKDAPGTAVYYAFLRYDKEGLFKNIELTTEEKYAQLRELEVRLTDKLAPDGIQPNYNSMLIRFDEAFAAVDDTLPVGDAFLEYLKVYGFMIETPASVLEEQIKALLPQLRLASKPDAEPQLLMEAGEEPPSSLFERLFSSRKTAKVVFAYEEGRTERNWIGAHEKGRQAMQEELGTKVSSGYIDGLTADNAYQELKKAASDADLVLITSTKLAQPALRFSLEHPDTLVLLYARVRHNYRLNTYYGRYFEPVFLCGVAAGLATETGKVAYVTPHIERSRHTADINAFALGAKSVRPGAEVMLIWQGIDRNDPKTCEIGIRNAVKLGVDIALVPDYPGLDLPGLPDGVFSLLLKLHDYGVPSQYLAAPAWNWDRFYTEIVKSYLNGSLDMLCQLDQEDPTVTGLWWGLGTGVFSFKSTDFLPPIANNLLQYLRRSIELGRFNPFRGPISDRNGVLRIAENSDPSPYEVLSMDWIADFINII